MALLSRLLASHRTTSPGVEENSPPQPVHPRPPPSRPEAWGLFAPESNDISHSQYYAQVAQGVLSTLSSTCRWLDPGDVEIFGEHPVAAGGFANIWEGTHDGRKVALKSYRCYESFDAADVVAVRCDCACVEPTANDTCAEVSQRSQRVDPPSSTRCGHSTACRGVLY